MPKNTVVMPHEPIKPKQENDSDNHSGKGQLVRGIISGGFAILITVVMFAMLLNRKDVSFGLWGVGFFLSGVLSCVSFLGYSKENKARMSAAREYSLKLEKYEADMKEYAIKKQEADQMYAAQAQAIKKDYDIALSEAQSRYAKKKGNHQLATHTVNQMYAPLGETKKTLQKLYELDILFPKYRNIVAVSTMYEYFASGRVSELEGAGGAYNLYEAELRQNLIINKMDVIIHKLEDIKANQYSLYTELQKTNKTLDGISSDVKKIVNNTETIANNTEAIAEVSHITAHCSMITAQNSEALKYIALING